MDEFLKTNRSLWNEWTKINRDSTFYDVAGFRAGKSSLKTVEIEEVGDVRGKSLLHLQCHFGLDTLSWARRGARVTGVDFSDESIKIARTLSEELGIEASFVCSDVLELTDALADRFDIVFTSYGVLSWLSDLNRWGEVVSHFLKPGGVFYIVEFHPVLLMMDEESGSKVKYDYFPSTEPLMLEEKGSYAAPEADFSHPSYQWIYTISDVLNALISAGLRIEFMHEFPYSSYNWLSFFEEDEEGCCWIKGRRSLPLMFSIKAAKPEESC